MFKRYLWIVAFFALTVSASAQNPVCPTRPANDSSNACANTEFVTRAVAGVNSTFPPRFVSGFQVIYNTITTIDLGSGYCRDSTNSLDIVLLTGQTKNLNATWVAGTGNGGLQQGLTFSSGTFYYLFAIYRADTAVTDYLISDSSIAPTLPTNYTNFCRIGAILTELASAQVRPFIQDISTNTWWFVTADHSQVSTAISATPSLLSLRVPPIQGIQAIINIQAFSTTVPYGACVRPGFSPCVSTTQDGMAVFTALANGFSGALLYMPVNSSRQISVVGSGAAGIFDAWVLGWQDNF